MPVALPLAISPNGRYFVGSQGEPFFWLGDTQWELCRLFDLADVDLILRKRTSQGFSVLQVMLTGVGDATGPNVAGDMPWVNHDPGTPNEAYFRHVDAVLQASGEHGLVVALGVFHQLHESRLTTANARTYARWVAERYGHLPNLIWAMYPAAEAKFVPVVRELAAGLREGDADSHLITVHPDPSPASSSFFVGEPWLDFHCIQTYSRTDLIAPMVTHDYHLLPTKPVVMAEGAYEGGEEYGFEVTPLWVRRQAYWTVLAGGHHSYGHNHMWRLRPTWREALDAPGATQLSILRKVLEGRSAWCDLVPDQSVIAACEAGDPALNMAARSASRQWSLVYLGAPATISVSMDAASAGSAISASWVAPTTGEAMAAGSFAPTAAQRFTTPPRWEDALLLLEAQ